MSSLVGRRSLLASVSASPAVSVPFLPHVPGRVQASLAAFDADFVQSVDMQDYIVNLQKATGTLEKSLSLPALGEHVSYLQNALVSNGCCQAS